MIAKNKRQLLNNILSAIDKDPGEENVDYMYDHEIDVTMTNVLAAIGEEANLEEVFGLDVIKDWVDDNISLLFPVNGA